MITIQRVNCATMLPSYTTTLVTIYAKPTDDPIVICTAAVPFMITTPSSALALRVYNHQTKK